MRLLRPSPGEAADRQSILHLKCQYGELKNMNIKPFTDEISELQTYLDVHYFHKITEETGEKYNGLFGSLARLNRDMWKLEDEVRIRTADTYEHKGPDNDARLLVIVRLIPQLNDKRAALVQEVNSLFSIHQQEKIYIAS